VLPRGRVDSALEVVEPIVVLETDLEGDDAPVQAGEEDAEDPDPRRPVGHLRIELERVGPRDDGCALSRLPTRSLYREAFGQELVEPFSPVTHGELDLAGLFVVPSPAGELL